MISNQSIRDKDLEEFNRKMFWERTNSAYATLKKRPNRLEKRARGAFSLGCYAC